MITEKQKILIVDDSRAIRSKLTRLMENNHYLVTTAEDGKVALELYNSNPDDIDLILSDLNMPIMDGIQLLKKITENGSEIPFIMLTSEQEASIAMDAIRIGASDYIVKDKNIGEAILLSVKRAFEKKQLVEQNRNLLQELSLRNEELKGFNVGLHETINKLTNIGASISSEKDVDLLLGKILDETTRMLDAERTSLFLYDEKTDELWVNKASKSKGLGEIRFKADKGIAGYVARERKTLNIEDAYSHDLFNREFDLKTGFTTKTILCVPMENQQNKLIGVVQVLNKKNSIFCKEDETILKMIASQAAISIENSRLTGYLKKSYFSLQLEKDRIMEEIGEKEVQASEGEIVGFRKYVIGDLLGKGAYGEVYMAKEVSELGEWPVAIKVLKDESFQDPVQMEKTKEEGRMVRKYLNGHQNIVSTYFTDVFSGSPYIAMEYIDGMTLAEFQASHKLKRQKVPIQLSSWIIKELCSALTYAWEVEKEDGLPLQMVHRDIKPSNILLTKGGTPKLSDFGIATESGENKTHERIIIGTPEYMSPEQAMGYPGDARSDIFSLGLVFYSLLFGASPYSGGSAKESLERAQKYDIPDLPILENYPGKEFEEVRGRVAAILTKALAKDPKDRYESAAAMFQAIKIDQLISGKVSIVGIKSYIRDFIKGKSKNEDRTIEEVCCEEGVTL